MAKKYKQKEKNIVKLKIYLNTVDNGRQQNK